MNAVTINNIRVDCFNTANLDEILEISLYPTTGMEGETVDDLNIRRSNVARIITKQHTIYCDYETGGLIYEQLLDTCPCIVKEYHGENDSL